MLAFPLHMAVMADGGFPFGAVGLVHVENRIVQHRPIGIGEELTLRVRADQARAAPEGPDLRAASPRSRVGGELVWESVSTILRRGKGDGEAERRDGASRRSPADDARPAPSGGSAATSAAATPPSPATATRSTCTR